MEQPGHTYNATTLFRVYISLLVLAAIMVALSFVPFEKVPVDFIDMHATKELAIFGVSILMGVIVAGFLMGLRYEKTLSNAIVFGSCFAFLLIFFLMTWADIGYRGVMDPSFGKQINWESPVDKANAAQAKEAKEAAAAAAKETSAP